MKRAHREAEANPREQRVTTSQLTGVIVLKALKRDQLSYNILLPLNGVAIKSRADLALPLLL